MFVKKSRLILIEMLYMVTYFVILLILNIFIYQYGLGNSK